MEIRIKDQADSLRKIIHLESNRKVIDFKRDLLSSKSRIVISITSGKGGVGKTNIVGNLGIAFRKLGKKVLILDADLGLANIDIIYGISPKFNIDDFIKGHRELSDIIVKGPEGVDVIPASSGVQELTDLSDGHKMHLLSEFNKIENEYEIFLIDTGAGISSNVTYFNIAANKRIVVITPEPTSLTDAYALIKVLHYNHHINNFLLLFNMVDNEIDAENLYRHFTEVVNRFMGGIDLEYIGAIIKDRYLIDSVRSRMPVICEYPNCNFSKSIMEIAEKLLKMEKENSDGNIKFFLNIFLNKKA